MHNILLEGLLFDLGSLAHLVAEVVELRATDLAFTNNLDLLDLRRVYRESTLNTNGEAHLSNGECLAARLSMTTNDIALEYLNTLTVSLGDAIVNLHVVARNEIRNVLFYLLLLNGTNDIHDPIFLLFCL